MTGTYRLLEERWIPVRRRDGSLDWIRPAQIVERDNPPLRIASPRPDFDAALTQILIGLVQTTMPPESTFAWRAAFDKPPSVEQLEAAFEPLHPAFFVDGDGPRFFQDLTLTPEEASDTPAVSSLLIETANAELFVKEGTVRSLSYPAAAMALATMQLNAPSGGRGHRTSMRGGGPLTTLILGDDLWQTTWLNIIPTTSLANLGNASLTGLQHTFPWLAPTRTSENDRATTLDDVHPAQMYWSMPRRFRLVIDPAERGRCDILGLDDVPVVRRYLTRHLGVKYEGFRHPLTPYRDMKAGQPPNPKKGQPDGLPYREWPQLALAAEGGNPAEVVRLYYQEKRFTKQRERRLWVSGFDVDNMKARCWYEHETPLFDVDPSLLSEMSQRVAQLVDASEDVRKTLARQVIAATKRRADDVKDLWSKMEVVAASHGFWARTEPAFFDSVAKIRALLENEPDAKDPADEWLRTLHEAALAEFDASPHLNAAFGDGDVKRVVMARDELSKFTHPRGTRMRKLVGLPPLEKEAVTKGRAAKRAPKGTTRKSTKKPSTDTGTQNDKEASDVAANGAE